MLLLLPAMEHVKHVITFSSKFETSNGHGVLFVFWHRKLNAQVVSRRNVTANFIASHFVH
jgi:hypothetical protein